MTGCNVAPVTNFQEANLCKKVFSISGGGVAQGKSHACIKIHLSRVKERQRKSLFNKDNVINLNQCRINFSHEKHVRKAEIIQALKSVESNYPFASANEDGGRFKEMFPHSQIDKKYKQNEKKMQVHNSVWYIPLLKRFVARRLKKCIVHI